MIWSCILHVPVTNEICRGPGYAAYGRTRVALEDSGSIQHGFYWYVWAELEISNAVQYSFSLLVLFCGTKIW